MTSADCRDLRWLTFDHPGSVLYFAVDDIRSMHDSLADREVRLADFEDTEGNTLALMSEPKLP